MTLNFVIIKISSLTLLELRIKKKLEPPKLVKFTLKNRHKLVEK
jgi:hypothetical protein